ncbi:MAG: N-6 DNA methylase [Bacteroidales bacterium]|nr:N-6 DNA methylase [Bacteroidales bacterium]
MATIYNSDNLRSLFRSQFDMKLWYSFLQYFFKATTLRVTPEKIENEQDNDGYYLGEIETSDSYRIGLFYYKIKQGSVLNRRVGLRNLVRCYINPTWGNFEAAIAVFDSGDHWRLSFISDIKGESTSPKRYTYLFGDSELLYKTAIDRFNFIQNKGVSFENLKKAFSVEALSDEFFNRYREQYANFIEHITGKRFVKVGNKWEERMCSEPNTELMQAFNYDEKRVRDYIKKMMGRITFLHFLQRKGWMCGDLNYMQNMFNRSAYQNDYLDSVLEPLFFGILNTKPEDRNALFTQGGWDKSLLAEWGEIPYLNGGLFEKDTNDETTCAFPAGYFKDLFQFFSEYNFTIDENDPNDAEIGVDPEMLGKIFENLLEDNKDKGAFYTPKEIVRYMCQESLIAYLEANTSIAKEKIRQFVLSPEEGIVDIPEIKKPKLLAALEEVKICDPAIGSGAFPMGLLNELLHCREVLSGEHYERAEIKKSIIQNNIYGVDIEKGAVDIARLRFWLSIVVDEEEASPLPNLDYKIMQGNSLIESYKGIDLSELTYKKKSKNDSNALSIFDDDINREQKILSQLLTNYYSCSDHNTKQAIRERIKDTINKQLEVQYFDENILKELKNINLAENNKFFLWHTWFSDVFNRGEDKNGFDIVIGNPPYIVVSDVDKERLYYKYKTKNCLELYSYFFEHSINILHHNGVLSFITGSLYTKGIKFEALRSFLENNSQLITYRNEGDEVFKNVNMPTSTILLYKSNITNWSFDDLLGNSNNIVAKMNASSKPLSSISIMQRGFEVGRDRVSKVEGKYRFLTGSNVEKYCYKTISYVNQDVVTEFQKDAIFYTGERLLIRETGSYLTVVYLDENLYCNRSLYSTIIKDSMFKVQYVVGILNSKAIQYYYQQKFKAETELFPKIRIKQAKQLPIPVASLTEQQLIMTLVEQIRTSKKMTPNKSIEKLEREIDKIVYLLYKLTDAEIKIIEQSI